MKILVTYHCAGNYNYDIKEIERNLFAYVDIPKISNPSKEGKDFLYSKFLNVEIDCGRFSAYAVTLFPGITPGKSVVT